MTSDRNYVFTITGVNPTDYTCVTPPILGANWVTAYNANANTIATLLSVSFGGPATGPTFGNGEFLISLSPPPVLFAATGNITMPMPNDPALVGASVATQGVRLDNNVMGPEIVLLNAQDLILGN